MTRSVTRVTVLRPAAYHQNLVGQAHAGLLQVPYSLDAPFTNVDLEDVAVVAADALCGAHAGMTLDLAGPEVLTTRQLTEEAAVALGRPVSDTRMPLADWVAGPGASLADQVRDDLLAMFAAYDEGGLVGDPTVLPRLLGRASTTWATRVSPVRGGLLSSTGGARRLVRLASTGVCGPAAGRETPADSRVAALLDARPGPSNFKVARWLASNVERPAACRHRLWYASSHLRSYSLERCISIGSPLKHPDVPTPTLRRGPGRHRGRLHRPPAPSRPPRRPRRRRRKSSTAPRTSPPYWRRGRAAGPGEGTTRWTSAPSTRCSRPPASP